MWQLHASHVGLWLALTASSHITHRLAHTSDLVFALGTEGGKPRAPPTGVQAFALAFHPPFCHILEHSKLPGQWGSDFTVSARKRSAAQRARNGGAKLVCALYCTRFSRELSPLHHHHHHHHLLLAVVLGPITD
ncbi:hypothetical protein BZA05DRAFT_63607 [Tricharina praecox]|uniref:uncharacterized protein n=1 Tax=Tricharina praecox TaxID=43433 RepID=UPI00222103DB|nr:uncharacterized protein BZA05DRAFT_63607 [Tricharina praecox]KAI5849928.1 hypothetical protein BZA05DRAFT_63607 [Tricharina praecox]